MRRTWRLPFGALLLRLAVPALLAVAALEAAPLYGEFTADSRLTPSLKEQLKDGSYAYAVAVDFDFEPEIFHIQRLQKLGTVAGREGHRIRVLQLTADQVWTIASLYWVKRVETLDETGI
jgi:hypothetical protein